MFAILQPNHGRAILFVLFLFGVTLVKGCEPVPSEYKAFFALDWERQQEEARNFPIEKQIDYYLAGKKYVHPPSSTLLYVVAERGKSAVPALLVRMKNEDSDSAKVYLLEVVRNIHDFHDNLSGEKEIVEQLREIVGGMRDANRKTTAERMLTDIVESRSPSE